VILSLHSIILSFRLKRKWSGKYAKCVKHEDHTKIFASKIPWLLWLKEHRKISLKVNIKSREHVDTVVLYCLPADREAVGKQSS